MKKVLIMTLGAMMAAGVSNARIWRVNNNIGATADFNNLQNAINTVAAGDTLHLESSAISYGAISITKRLIIRGPGYLLNETVSNPKTQYLKDPAYIQTLTLSPGSKGSVVEGISNDYVYLNDSLLTYQRNYVGVSLSLSSSKDVSGDTVRNNFIDASIYLSSGNYKTKGLFLYNNIIRGQMSIHASLINNAGGYVINNTFVGNSAHTCSDFIFQNNIFLNANFGIYKGSNVFSNNISADANLPAGNGNVPNIPATNLFVGGTTGAGYSTDGRYALKAGSPAIGGGVLNGVTVDCGAYGGPAPYVLSGMPQMPSIYNLSMPTQINAGTSTINISVSAAAH